MLAGSSFLRSLREAAPTLSRRFFSCHTGNLSAIPRRRILRNQNPPSTHVSRAKPRFPVSSIIAQARAFTKTNVARIAQSQNTAAVRKPFFPDTSTNTVAYWLLASAASVFGIVVFGGLTRLTESGLSITEWRPVTGSVPPRSDADWELEFTKYKSSPEFHLLNSRMTLEEFKSIYWMEWIHRLWGRAVGLTFVLPAVYFVARRQVSKSMSMNLAAIAGLIGFQGFIGWWMVKSGLKDDLFAPGSHPRVSQYRLAAHLGTAFICYTAMLWNGLNILRTNKLLALSGDAVASTLFSLRNPALRPFKVSVALLAGLVFTTAMSGALVAGLDAGLIYNEFPYMGVGLTPPKSELFDPFYSRDKEAQSDLWWRNMLENPSLVQLDHRILATTTFSSVLALFAYTKYSPAMKAFLPKAAARGVHGVVGFACLQVVLGITTLLWLVPISLASAHQAGALALLTWTTVLGSRIWYPKAAAQILQKRMSSNFGGTTPNGGYSFPAVAKVTPNLGATTSSRASDIHLVQATSSALVAGLSSAFIAQSELLQGSNNSMQQNQQVFLKKQGTLVKCHRH